MIDIIPAQEYESNKLWLYKEGDERTLITGGWKNDGYYDDAGQIMYPAVKYATYMSFYATDVNFRVFGTYLNIDLKKYKTLNIDINHLISVAQINLTRTKEVDDRIIQSPTLTTLGRIVWTADISSINSKAYLMFMCSKNCKFDVYNVWLEK